MTDAYKGDAMPDRTDLPAPDVYPHYGADGISHHVPCYSEKLVRKLIAEAQPTPEAVDVDALLEDWRDAAGLVVTGSGESTSILGSLPLDDLRQLVRAAVEKAGGRYA